MISRLLQISLLVFGLGISTLLCFTQPTTLNVIILLLYIPITILTVKELRLSPSAVGVVQDQNGNPMQGVSLGLFQSNSTDLIAKRVTDQMGRYLFTVEDGTQYDLRLMDKGLIASSAEPHIDEVVGSEDLVAISTKIRATRIS